MFFPATYFYLFPNYNRLKKGMCNYASEIKNSMCNYSQYYFSYRDFFRTNVESYIISNFLHEIFVGGF